MYLIKIFFPSFYRTKIIQFLRYYDKMKQSIIMNVQWDISMPCLNGMPIALNNPFIKAHNWIQAEPSIDSSFSSKIHPKLS